LVAADCDDNIQICSNEGGGGGGGGGAACEVWGEAFGPSFLGCFGPPEDPPSTFGSATLCGAANGLTPDQQLAVETVMGENSWYLLGHLSYLPGDSRGNPTGPTITASSVFTEDLDMFSVLANRANTKGYPSTIGAVATQRAQFHGYSNGITLYNDALNSVQGSSPCNDLTGVVDAMNAIFQTGPLLPSNYLYWKAINQGKIGFHQDQPGDLYVANTAFGTINTH
jgi:hypothetical protein